MQKRNPIRIVNLSRRFGITPGILAGFSVSKGDAIIYMDSDLQDPPELIPKLIEKFNNGTDVVHTKRTKRLGEGMIKMILTKIAYRIINKTSSIPLPVDSGDFKLLSRKVVDHINALKEHNPYIRGLTVWVGFKQDFVDYVRESRSSGESKFSSIWSGPIAEFVRGITGYSTGPLYLGVIVGLFGLFFSARTLTIILSSSSLVSDKIVSASSILASFKTSSSNPVSYTHLTLPTNREV